MNQINKDIYSRKDIEFLLNLFYSKVQNDNTISHFFKEINLTDHLPIITDFWCSLLLNERKYFGNPMQKHIELHKVKKLNEADFSFWLKLFIQTIDENFEGTKAEEMKLRAKNIANLMLFKINGLS